MYEKKFQKKVCVGSFVVVAVEGAVHKIIVTTILIVTVAVRQQQF